MTDTPWLQWFEVVFGLEVAAIGERLMLRPERKSVRWMMDSVAEFFCP